jgi:hypothetical protein
MIDSIVLFLNFFTKLTGLKRFFFWGAVNDAQPKINFSLLLFVINNSLELSFDLRFLLQFEISGSCAVGFFAKNLRLGRYDVVSAKKEKK